MRMTGFRAFGPFAIAGLLLLSPATAERATAAADPRAFIGDLGNQAIQVLAPSVSLAERSARFRQLLDADFDLPDIARFVLGPYGRELSPASRQEFLAVFRDSIAQAYSAKLAQYAGEPFRVTGSRPSGGETVVTSQVVRHNGAPVEIDWHVIDHGGRPLVTDVYIDGVSMKAAQRSEFAGIIERNGGRADALVAVLRQQVAQAR